MKCGVIVDVLPCPLQAETHSCGSRLNLSLVIMSSVIFMLNLVPFDVFLFVGFPQENPSALLWLRSHKVSTAREVMTAHYWFVSFLFTVLVVVCALPLLLSDFCSKGYCGFMKLTYDDIWKLHNSLLFIFEIQKRVTTDKEKLLKWALLQHIKLLKTSFCQKSDWLKYNEAH